MGRILALDIGDVRIGIAVSDIMGIIANPLETYKRKGDLDKDVVLCHAGTALKDGKLVTAGGRVLGVVAKGTDIEDARKKVYANAEKISFDGMYYRKDIGAKALAAKEA